MDIVDLKDKLNLISSKIPKSQWKYFHQGSLYNFIYNINLIEDISLKNKISDIIFSCIKDIELNFEPDVDYSLYLFNTYLKGIIPTYRDLLGFSGVSSKYALIVCGVFLVSIFILLYNILIWEVLFCCLTVILCYKKLTNFLKHKAYGFCY